MQIINLKRLTVFVVAFAWILSYLPSLGIIPYPYALKTLLNWAILFLLVSVLSFIIPLSFLITSIRHKRQLLLSIILFALGLVWSLDIWFFSVHTLAFFAPFSRSLYYFTHGWKKYLNTSTPYQYSFYYPSNWVISECGDGEIVLAKKQINKCLYPLEASKEYIDSVYLQIFLPGKRHAAIPYNKTNPFIRLNGWSVLFFDYNEDLGFYRRMFGDYFPVKPDGQSLYKLTNNQGEEIVTGYLTSFTVGIYPHKNYPRELTLVSDSINYSYK